MFQGKWEQLNLYKFSLKGDVDGEGRGVSRYDEQGRYKENLTEHENTGQFWKGKRTPRETLTSSLSIFNLYKKLMIKMINLVS